VWWFILLAMIVAVTAPILKGETVVVGDVGEKALWRPWEKRPRVEITEEGAEGRTRIGKLVQRER
jgi:hypothetical protein